MEHEKNERMCEWCGRHKDGRYLWLRLVLAVLIGVFIFFAGIQIGEMRGEVYGGAYGGHMMRWHNEGGEMMMDNSMMPGQDGSTTIMMVPANGTSPSSISGQAIPTTKTPAASVPANGAPVTH